MVRSENLSVILVVLGVWWLALGKYAVQELDVVATGVILVVIGVLVLWNELKKNYVFKSNESSPGRTEGSEE